MKSFTFTLLCTAILIIGNFSCKKDSSEESSDNYSSMSEFYAKNSTQFQTFSIDATTGGTFTGSEGTIVTIPPNAFINDVGAIISGAVTIKLKEIYKKSDMLLSDRPTVSYYEPLVSGGEFSIKAEANGVLLKRNPGKIITLEMPADSIDNNMEAFFGEIPSSTKRFNWVPSGFVDSANVIPGISSYVFSLYDYTFPTNGCPDSGSWGNCDNPSYFNGPKTQLTLHGKDSVSIYNTDLFLVFKKENTMVHIYYESADDFPYLYAPLNRECTVVAIGMKNGKLYSSFTPITITNNLTVDFFLKQTTTEEFKVQLKLLN